MARLPIPGSDDGKWGQILNDYLSQSHTADGKIKAGAVSKSDIGLGNVDNTSDANKPISSAAQTALNAKLNTADLDAQTAAKISDDQSATAGALSTSVTQLVDATDIPGQVASSVRTSAVLRDGVFIPSSTAALRWRQIRTRVLAGDRQGHIAFMGDSIPYGAAGTGASNPKPKKNYPGRLRSILAGRHGAAGGGFTLADNNLFSNMAWDPRWTKAGNVVTHTFGPHRTACWRLDGADSATYLEFTDTCSEFWLYTLSSGGTFTASVDGGADITLNNHATGGGTVPRESGYFAYPVGAATSAQNVYRIPAGSTGQHTIRLTPSTNASNDLFVVAIEGRIPTPGTFRVGNMSISGKSYNSFFTSSSETSGLVGITMLDMLRADLLVCCLGINDWQGQRPLAEVKSSIGTTVARQRQTGTSSTNGGTYPGGDAVLLWNPKPDVNTLGGGSYTNPSWDAYREMMYEAAVEFDVPLIDLGDWWGGSYAAANSRGLYSDAIHPNDAGADDLATTVDHAICRVL